MVNMSIEHLNTIYQLTGVLNYHYNAKFDEYTLTRRPCTCTIHIYSIQYSYMEHVWAYIYYTYGQGESGGLLPELRVDAIDEVVVQKHLSVFLQQPRTAWRHAWMGWRDNSNP